jgi:hypothetical protein
VRGGDENAEVTLHFTHKWSVFGSVSGSLVLRPTTGQ